LDNLFSDATLFKLNFIGIQHLEYLDIREIKTPEKPLTLQKGQGFVEGHKILTLTLTLLTPTHDPWRVGKPLHITNFLPYLDLQNHTLGISLFWCLSLLSPFFSVIYLPFQGDRFPVGFLIGLCSRCTFLGCICGFVDFLCICRQHFP